MSAQRCEEYQYSVAKLCDALDFFEPRVIDWIRQVGEEPRFHTKQWEWAQILEARRLYADSARTLVGLGTGTELILPVLARDAEQIIATDLYESPGAWKHTAGRRPDEVFPELDNLRVHSMDMRKIDLPPESADFVWSLCSIEHVGHIEEILDALRQAGRLLKPGGLMAITTEYAFSERSLYVPRIPSGNFFYLDQQKIRRMFTDTGLHLVEPIDLRLSTHPMNVPVWEHLNNSVPNLPHVLYRAQPLPLYGVYAACICLVLSREDHGNDYFIEDPQREEKLAPLFKLGRSVSRRLTTPLRWWYGRDRW